MLRDALAAQELIGTRADEQPADQPALQQAAKPAAASAAADDGDSWDEKVAVVMRVRLGPAGQEAPQTALAGSGAKAEEELEEVEAVSSVQEGASVAVLVGDVETIATLTDCESAPADLLAAYHDAGHWCHAEAQGAIGQAYTYMRLWGVCHGFISCWNATWLLYAPPDRCTHLYLSRPFLAAAASTVAEPRATMLGAMAWQQHRALRFACEGRRIAAWPGTVGEPAAAAGGSAGASGGGGGDRDRAADGAGDGASAFGAAGVASGEARASGPGRTPAASAGEPGRAASPCAALHRDAAAGDAPGPAAAAAAPEAGAAPQRHPPAAATARLRFTDAVGDTTVFRGTCDGAPALIKVFTLAAHAGYRREAEAYRVLAPLQGAAVPKVLAHGQLPFGLRYIALERVQSGQRLRDCKRPFPRAVAKAALQVLRKAQAACPGFVHGDLQLDNILLVPGVAATAQAAEGAADALGSGGGGPCCVLLDLARSRIHGNPQPQRQKEERARLRQLLVVEEE
ncbi:hypothetical protein GPECTOR_7g1054 [Gonium pectorale]|uniref:Protein kinase domain-containing protein n=1 Tax=Gonium pectorale TaxID=33097 RepID=A0A150GTV2_GONPE|nr:hypothetical protein GPECTOR_7g1054 [Gonium pectorale]|eukprot:KXZ53162.1 hypothetical protein GPECTOR_7g1054 [Gonium pectorale]